MIKRKPRRSFFGGFSLGEAFVNCLGPGGFQNFFHGLGEEIAKRKVSLVVQAAGDHRSVAEDAYLVPQAVAEADLTLRSGKVGPVEFVPVFQKYSGI